MNDMITHIKLMNTINELGEIKEKNKESDN